MAYRKLITQISIYGTFTHPMAVTAVKLQQNHKRFTATHTTFPTMLIEIAVCILSFLLETEGIPRGSPRGFPYKYQVGFLSHP